MVSAIIAICCICTCLIWVYYKTENLKLIQAVRDSQKSNEVALIKLRAENKVSNADQTEEIKYLKKRVQDLEQDRQDIYQSKRETEDMFLEFVTQLTSKGEQ